MGINNKLITFILFDVYYIYQAIKNHFGLDTSKKKIKTQKYNSSKLFPEWMLKVKEKEEKNLIIT